MFVLPVEEPDDCKDPADNVPFFPGPKMTGDLYIYTDRVNEIWESVQGKVTIKSAIGDRQYAMRDFSIRDNYGYEFCFGQDISSQQP